MINAKLVVRKQSFIVEKIIEPKCEQKNLNNKYERQQLPKIIKSSVVQSLDPNDNNMVYEMSSRGNKLLYCNDQKYIRNNVHGSKVYWKCTKWHNGCKARAITSEDKSPCFLKNIHNHQ